MNVMNYDRKVLKERAKASLRGVQPRPWKVTLLAWLLVGLIPGIITFALQLVGNSGIFAYLREIYTDPTGWSIRIELMDADELLGYYARIMAPMAGAGLLATFVSILIRLFQLVMSYGYANYSLKLYRGEPTETRNIFSGFPLAGRAILTGIVTYIFEFLWSCLAVTLGICATMILTVLMAAMEGSTAVLALGIVLLIVVWVAVVLFSVFISYRYSLAPYFILTTDMGIMDAIRESKNAMRGNLGRRFMLDLSFIGWGLVNGLIVMGVMLVGYFLLIFVMFLYLNVLGRAIDTGAVAQMDLMQIMTPMFIGMAGIAVVAEIASLPIGLWLTAYQGSARAGFFLTVTGQDDGSAPSAPAPEYIPPQPSGIWDNVPTPPSFTTPPAPPAPPQPPVIPEQPEDLAGPGPDDSIPAAPATAEETSAPAPEPPAQPETEPEEVPASDKEAVPPTEDGEG